MVGTSISGETNTIYYLMYFPIEFEKIIKVNKKQKTKNHIKINKKCLHMNDEIR